MKKITTLLLLAILFSLQMTTFAQMPKTVSWRLTVKMTSAKEGIATLKAVIEPGWHLYGTKLPSGGPNPTVIDFSQSQGVKPVDDPTVSPAPVTALDKLFEMKLSWWEGDVVWKQRFIVTDPSAANVKCTVRYNTCNNQTCTMPVTETLSRKVAR